MRETTFILIVDPINQRSQAVDESSFGLKADIKCKHVKLHTTASRTHNTHILLRI
jgi:hypothetical protein